MIAAETALSDVDGEHGRLTYRGRAVGDLVERHSFEEAAHLLWTGRLPTAEESEWLRAAFAKGRSWAAEVFPVIDRLPTTVNATDAASVGLLSLPEPNATTNQVEQAAMHCAALATFVLRHFGNQHGQDYRPPETEEGYSSAFLRGLHGVKPSASQVTTLDAYFILTMEHSLNASTFAARVTTSTRATMNRALVSAIATMSGELHGGAPKEVIGMFEAIGTADAAPEWMEQQLAQGKRIMGFGHRVYRTIDPRAAALKHMLLSERPDDPEVRFALSVEQAAQLALQQHKPGRSLYPNVEFWAACLLRSLGIPKSLYTATFCCSRVVGWTAHIMEQAACDTLIRPKAVYVNA